MLKRVGRAACGLGVAACACVAFLSLPVIARAAVSPVLAGTVSDSVNLSGVSATAVASGFANPNYAYVASYNRGSVSVVDISNPAQPVVVGESAVANSLLNATNISIAGGYAYVVSKNRNGPSGTNSNDDGTGNSLTILDISTNPLQPLIVGSIRDPVNLFGGYGIAVSGSYAYIAAQGCLTGQPCPNTQVGDSFAVVDVSSPSNPTLVATLKNSNLPAPWAGTGALRHVTGVAVAGNYAYVTASYANRLTVIDISNPANPTIVASVQDANKLDFDVDVAVANGYAYVADQGTAAGRVAVVDVHNPAQPQIVGVVPSNGGMLNGAYRIKLRGDFAFVSAYTSNAVAAVDVSNPVAPRYAGAVQSTASLYKTIGLDVDVTGRFVIANSPSLSTQTGGSAYPPYPFQPGGPTVTGTVSSVDFAPAPISIAITASSKPPSPTTQTSANFAFAANLAVASVRCRLDGGPYTLCTSATTQSYTSLAPGTHTFDVQARDTAGNTAAASYTWTIFPVAPATAPATPVLDGFDGPDGPVGSNWSLIRSTGFAGMNVSSNTAVDASTTSFAWNYWNASNPGPDSEAYVTVSRLGTLDTIRVGARVVGGTNAHSGYYVSVTTAGNWSIIRIDNGGTPVTLASVARPIVSGDRVGIRVIGSVVTALHQSGTGGWVQVLSYDTTADSVRYANAGRVAIEFKTSALDDFGGGTYVQPSPPANSSPPSVSGSAVEGQVLTASPGVWSGQPAPTFAYQWLRCDPAGANCASIANATDSTYTAVTADVGSTVAVAVTGTNSSGSAGPVNSAATAVVQAATTPPANSSAPTISGSAVEAQVLTASPGAWSGQPAPTFAYQWLRCNSSGANCTPIANATATTYTLVTADVGSTIAVAVTGSNSAGSAGPVSSATTAVVQAATTPPANSSPPTISGSAVEGQVLTASPGSWSGNPAPTFAYQWLRCDSAGSNCSSIVNATGTTYTLVTGDVGSTVAVAVTGSNSAGSAGPINSAPTVVVQAATTPPANSSPPTISGSPVEGQVLTASPGAWSGQPAPTFAYQWLRCNSSGANCTPLANATATTYTLVTADVGSTVAVAVTGSNSAGSAGPVSSAPTAVVQAATTPPANSSPPTVSGSAVEGQVLTAAPGVWSGQPAPTFAYQWLRCNSSGANCTPLANATATTYTLVTADVGSTVAVAVTGSNSAGSAGPVSSAPTGVVQSATTPPANSSPPTISGSAADGQVLTASPGAWSGQPAPTFAYQWLRCDSAGANCVSIANATAATYTLVTADVGSTIAVAVTGTNSAGSAGPVTSAPTAVVASSLAPTTAVLDNFNRANGAAGANWTMIRPTGFAVMNVSANAAIDSSTTAFTWDYWNVATFGPNCEAYVTVAKLGASDVIRIGGRVTNAGLNTHSGYYVAVTSAGAWTILRVDNGGSPVTLASGSRPLAAGDKVAIRIVGSVVKALHYSSSGGWFQVLSYDTAADAIRYSTAGRLALEFRTSTLDDFGGGSLP